MKHSRITQFVAVCILLLSNIALAQKSPSKLEADLALLEQEPAWIQETSVQYDLSKPWSEARLEIRRLLGENKYREAIKLTWLYKNKDDIGNGHEWPMYLFLGGEFAWCIKVYNERIPELEKPGNNVEPLAYQHLAACYRHYGELDKALEVLKRALNYLPPKPWTEMRKANVLEELADIYVQKKDFEKAKEHYRLAIAELRKAQPPYGKHLIPKNIAKIQARRDMIDLKNLDLNAIKDGVYSASMPGYTNPVTVNVQIKGGRIADVKVKHSDKIELNSTTIVPRRIVEQQNVQVDGVTGATITSQAIMTGAFEALRNAPRK